MKKKIVQWAFALFVIGATVVLPSIGCHYVLQSAAECPYGSHWQTDPVNGGQVRVCNEAPKKTFTAGFLPFEPHLFIGQLPKPTAPPFPEGYLGPKTPWEVANNVESRYLYGFYMDWVVPVFNLKTPVPAVITPEPGASGLTGAALMLIALQFFAVRARRSAKDKDKDERI